MDSLSVIQADEIGGQSADFEQEAVRLGDYYGQTLCTIAAAAAASDSSQGLFIPRPAARFTPSPCAIHRTHTLPNWQKDIHIDLPTPTYKDAIKNSVLLGRGRITQEIEFSRVLFFGRSCLAWKCRAGWRFEDGSIEDTGMVFRARGCMHCNDITVLISASSCRLS